LADFAQSLNKDTVNSLFTSARYGTAEAKWLSDIALPAVSATLQNAASSSGNGTDFTIDGYGTVLLEVTGTFVASMVVKGSMDGTNFNSTLAVIKLDTGARSTTITASGTYKVISPAGLQKIQAVLTWTSGTSVTVKGRALPLASNDNTVEVSGRKEKVMTNYVNTSTSLDPGSENITINAPAGYISKIQGISFYCPAPVGAGTGTHSMTVYLGTASSICQLYTKSVAYNVVLEVSYADVAATCKDREYDATFALIIKYTNGSNVAQTGIRGIRNATTDRAVIA